MSSCIACSIVNRKLDACIIYETDNFICFLDHRPINKGHVLICPKKHYINIYDLPNGLAADIFLFAKKVAAYFEKTLKCDGVSLLQNNGYYNELSHFHLHVFPRFINDGFSWNVLSKDALSFSELSSAMMVFSDFD